MVRTLLAVLLLVLGSGCAAFERVDWAEVGRNVALTSLTAAATHNEKVAELLEKNDVEVADITNAVNGAFAAAKGDLEGVVDNSIEALERRIPGTPTGPETPTDPLTGLWPSLGMAGLYVLNQIRKAKNGKT